MNHFNIKVNNVISDNWINSHFGMNMMNFDFKAKK